jgi:hypothetical protein
MQLAGWILPMDNKGQSPYGKPNAFCGTVPLAEGSGNQSEKTRRVTQKDAPDQPQNHEPEVPQPEQAQTTPKKGFTPNLSAIHS